MIRTIIVEDELMAQKSLENLCGKNKNIELVEIYSSAEDALAKINESNIQLVLLDIEMPGMSGLEMMDEMSYLPQVIFTTGNKEYAYEAFEYDITDFLKKPITPERFSKAIEKVVDVASKQDQTALASIENEIYLKTDGRYVRLAYDDILYFENVGDYIKAITSHGNYIFHETLKALDAKISNPRFLKVHRSYIVNMGKIKDIEDNSIVINDKLIPVSRAYKSLLMKSINII